MKKIDWKKACIIGLYFGGFQAIMPVIGYFLGSTFENIITNFDHWIAFFLLAIIGGNMIKESFSKESENINDDVNFKTMIILAIATSIDALAVGITFAFSKLAEEESDFVIYKLPFDSVIEVNGTIEFFSDLNSDVITLSCVFSASS